MIEDISSQVLHIVGSLNMQPRGVQERAIEHGLLDGKSIMISSPTGSGKTLVGEMGALRAVLSGKRAMYLVPLRALAGQIHDVLTTHFSKYNIKVGVSTGDFHLDAEHLAQCDIVVTTYERADSLLRRNAAWLSELGTVVIDEIQTISEPGRGARLESLIIRLRRLITDLQIVALSATIGEPDELAEWLGCDLVHSEDRPVPLHYSIVPTSDRFKTMHNLVMTTVRSDGQVIVFGRTRKDAERYATRLAIDVGRQMTNAEKTNLDSELGSVENFDVNLPPELKALLHDSVAFHHAGLSYAARDLVERLFKRGLVRVICATATLSAGIDFPARTVIVVNARSPQDHRRLLSANRIHQMLGRAGRPGKDKFGIGIILAGSDGEASHLRQRYFDVFQDPETDQEVLIPKYERVRSVLNESEALTEQLLVALDAFNEVSLDELEDTVFGESYLVFCGIRDTRSPLRLLNLGEISATSAIEKHALGDTIRAARENVIGRVVLREKNDTTIGGLARDWDGAQYTCRFSSRVSSDGLVEGPMCSCGTPIDGSGILCSHLVALGYAASKELGSLADYVIPLALGETSPFRVLVRLDLAEGGFEGKVRPTPLGRLVNRLYLRISTIREMRALLPSVHDSADLLWLLRHLISLEMGSEVNESFDELLAGLVSTDQPLSVLAANAGLSEGDAYGLVDTARWLTTAISVVADHGGLVETATLAQSLLLALERKSPETKATQSKESE
ncbi:MAG: DEAD/DEAH box helicase [Candidatus Thorarchaeota archaeon]|nr:DEAD/DEAH box helicase [Candidatus Thorarchaeota archaeon]